VDEAGAVHRLDHGGDVAVVAAEAVDEAGEAVPVGGDGATLDQRGVLAKGVEVESLAAQVQSDVQHGRASFGWASVTDVNLPPGGPFFMAFLTISRASRAHRRDHSRHSSSCKSRQMRPRGCVARRRACRFVYGALSTLDDGEPAGVALAVQIPDRDAVVALLEDERTGVDVFQGVDIHDWEFGGRR
jgi:hypothetical protein